MATDAARPCLILWDIDHTLIETRGIGGQLARAAFQEVAGIQVEQMADATGKTERAILTETLRAHNIQPTEHHQREFARALPEQYRRHAGNLREVGRALPGAAEALAALRQVPGIVQTVLTGNYRDVATVKLTAFHLDGLLDLDVGAYAEDATERAALISIAQHRAAGKYSQQFTRENTIIIGDTSLDVEAAQQGGAAIIAVASGRNTAGDLRAAGAATTLSDLTDTDALLQAVQDQR